MNVRTLKPKVYLAGPDVFLREAKDAGEKLKAICDEFGLCGLYPLDGPPIPLEHPNAAMLIRNANIRKLREAEAVVANITPFRGPHMDPGTAMEIGFATHAGMPVFLYSAEPRILRARIAQGSYDGPRNFDRDGFEIENFDLPENLMITPSRDRRFHVHAYAHEAIKTCAQFMLGENHAD